MIDILKSLLLGDNSQTEQLATIEKTYQERLLYVVLDQLSYDMQYHHISIKTVKLITEYHNSILEHMTLADKMSITFGAGHSIKRRFSDTTKQWYLVIDIK